MKNIFSYFLIFLATNILFSCDCMKYATGIVYDSKTKLPLDNVAYNGSNRSDVNKITNEKGEFVIMKIEGRRCGIVKAFFSKENYKTKKVKFENRSEKNAIYLERLNVDSD